MLVDAICIGGCWCVSVLGYHALGGQYDPAFYLKMWPVVVAFIGVNVLFRLYHGRFFYPAAPFSPVEEMRRLVGSAVLVHLGVVAVLALARQSTVDYSRGVILISGVLTAFWAQPLRDFARKVLMRGHVGQMPVVLAGRIAAVARLAKILEQSSYLGFRAVGYFSDDAAEVAPALPRLGGVRDIVSASQQHNVRILLTCQDERELKCQIASFSKWFTHVEYLPASSAFPILGARPVTFDGLGGIELVNQSRMRVLVFEKWALDKVLSLFALVLSTPLMLLIAVGVKLTSPGPVFFRHERLGRNGRPIRIWKFRTMYNDAAERLKMILANSPEAAAEWQRSFKLRNDPRITRFGRFLRRTSLDELPQFINVFRGEMALIGPRPIVAAEVPYYGAAYEVFSRVRPGMTGLWQCTGRSDADYDRRVALDTYYIYNWSPWMDLWICVQTLFAVLRQKGAV